MILAAKSCQLITPPYSTNYASPPALQSPHSFDNRNIPARRWRRVWIIQTKKSMSNLAYLISTTDSYTRVFVVAMTQTFMRFLHFRLTEEYMQYLRCTDVE